MLDYPIDDVGWVDGVHSAFPCRTFNTAIAHHRPWSSGAPRARSSSISPEATQGVLDVRHCIELLREARRASMRGCVLMEENPDDGLPAALPGVGGRGPAFGLVRRTLTTAGSASRSGSRFLERHPGAPPGKMRCDRTSAAPRRSPPSPTCARALR